MAQAVIKTGGKQYLVSEGGQIKVEKIPLTPGTKVVFDEVLLTSQDGSIIIGTPLITQASVEGEVVAQGRRAKIMGVKMKAKKRQRHLFGHRQTYTEVKINRIVTASVSKSKS